MPVDCSRRPPLRQCRARRRRAQRLRHCTSAPLPRRNQRWPRPVADVAAESAVPVQMWTRGGPVPVQMWPGGEPSPGADVAAVSAYGRVALRLRRFCSGGNQRVLFRCTRGTHCALTGCSPFTHAALTRHSFGTHWALIGHSRGLCAPPPHSAAAAVVRRALHELAAARRQFQTPNLLHLDC